MNNPVRDHWTVNLTYAVETRVGRACGWSMARNGTVEPARILGWLAGKTYVLRKDMEHRHDVTYPRRCARCSHLVESHSVACQRGCDCMGVRKPWWAWGKWA